MNLKTNFVSDGHKQLLFCTLCPPTSNFSFGHKMLKFFFFYISFVLSKGLKREREMKRGLL